MKPIDQLKKALQELARTAPGAEAKALIGALLGVLAVLARAATVTALRMKSQASARRAGADAVAREKAANMQFMSAGEDAQMRASLRDQFEKKERERIAQLVVTELQPELDAAVKQAQNALDAFKKAKAKKQLAADSPFPDNADDLRVLLALENARAAVDNWSIERIAKTVRAHADAEDIEGLRRFWRAAQGRVRFFADTPTQSRKPSATRRNVDVLSKEQRMARSLQISMELWEEKNRPEELRAFDEFEQSVNDIWRVILGYTPDAVQEMTSSEFMRYAASKRDPWDVKPDFVFRWALAPNLAATARARVGFDTIALPVPK